MASDEACGLVSAQHPAANKWSHFLFPGKIKTNFMVRGYGNYVIDISSLDMAKIS